MSGSFDFRKTNELDSLFAERWSRQGLHNFIFDGIVYEKEWQKAEPKVLFVLKDANDPPGKDRPCKDWDLREFLRNGAYDGTRGYTSTWGLLSRWVYGLRENYCSWEDTNSSGKDFSNHHDRRSLLRTIAAINLKKSGGGGQTNQQGLKEATERDAKLIAEEIEIIEPDIIVGCGTGWLFSTLYPEEGQLANVRLSSGVVCQRNLQHDWVLLHYYHPQARYPHNLMYTMLMFALEEAWVHRNNL